MPPSHLPPFLVVIVLFSSHLTYVYPCGTSAGGMGKEHGQCLFHATGQSLITIPAESADISVTVEHRVSRNQETSITTEEQVDITRQVLERTATVMTRVLGVLQKEYDTHVTQVQTKNVRLQPVYSNSYRSVLTGYDASNSVSFRVPLPSVSPVLERLFFVEVSRLDSISYAASTASIAAARLRAVQSAIDDAQQQAKAAAAQIYSGAADTDKITVRVLDVDMTASAPASVPMPSSFSDSTASASARSYTPQPVVGGELTVTARANVKFVIGMKTTTAISDHTIVDSYTHMS